MAVKKTTRKTTASKTPAKKSKQMKVTVVPSEQAIRERAYYIYLESGGAATDEVANWHQAERELIKR